VARRGFVQKRARPPVQRLQADRGDPHSGNQSWAPRGGGPRALPCQRAPPRGAVRASKRRKSHKRRVGIVVRPSPRRKGELDQSRCRPTGVAVSTRNDPRVRGWPAGRRHRGLRRRGAGTPPYEPRMSAWTLPGRMGRTRWEAGGIGRSNWRLPGRPQRRATRSRPRAVAARERPLAEAGERAGRDAAGVRSDDGRCSSGSHGVTVIDDSYTANTY